MVKISEFLESKGMNYAVSKQAAIVRGADDAKGAPTFREVEGQWHLVRSTDGEVISPSTVSDRYAPINPQQLVAPLDPLLQEGWITPDEGYLFKRGSHEVIRFRIDGGELEKDGDIMGEKWVHYFSIHNHQGGGGKVRGLVHHQREICKNQIVRLSSINGFSIRHTGEIQKNYDWAVSTWKKLKEEIREISKRMEIFASKGVTAVEAEAILRTIYGVEGKQQDEISTRTANELEFAIQEFSNPRRGTYGKSLADVYNAITSTNTHYTPKNSKEDTNKRLASIFDEQGSRNKLEAATMETLLELAGIEG